MKISKSFTHTWKTPAGEAITSVVAVKGADLSAFQAQANAAVKDYREDLNTLYLVFDKFVADGTTYTATTKVGGVIAGKIQGSVGMTMHTGFDINFIITKDSYALLDAATQALFTEAENYYVFTEAAERAVNQAFTDAVYTLTVVDGEYTYALTYKANVVDYVTKTFSYAASTDKDKTMAYSIAAYLNSAYAYFTNKDVEDYSELAKIVTDNADYKADVTFAESTTNIGTATGHLDIAIDLDSTPAWAITSDVNGTVKFNGETYTLVAGEETIIEASVMKFDNVLTFNLEGGLTGTYDLAAYVERMSGDGATLDALLAAFYTYVIYADKF